MIRSIPPTLSGLFAALPTPFSSDGTLSLDDLDGILDFLLQKHIKGLCVGGVTGEYASLGVEERERLFHSISRRVQGVANLILGIGAERAAHVLRLGRAAAESGAVAVLLPPPSFIPFNTVDLLSFMKRVADELPLPVLLYNIPQFTHNLGIRKMLNLVDSVPKIVGIKDSSGKHLNLPIIQEARSRTPMAFFIGSDELLFEALEHGADGAISGVSSACPELLLATYEAYRSGTRERARVLQERIGEFCARSAELPPPWAIKLALQARGINAGGWCWPPSRRLALKMKNFQDWFSSWKDGFDPGPTVTAQESLSRDSWDP